MTEFTYQSSTGKEIAARIWKREQNTYRGVVQLVHGMEEHIGRYDDFANELTKCGYLVVGHDHLGHGKTAKTEEDFGYFASEQGWERLAEDIHILQNQIQEQYPDIPCVIFGHSMGSLLVRTYLTKYNDPIDGVILSGTSGQKAGLWIGQILAKGIEMVKGERYRSKLLEYLVTGSFNRKFKPNRTDSDWTTRKEEMVDKYKKDPLCGKNFTVKGYQDLLRGSYYLSKQKNINTTKHVPILLISGDKDPVGAMGKGVIRVYHMLQKAGLQDITIRLFKDARHELLNETNRDEVYYVIFHWLQETLENKKSE